MIKLKDFDWKQFLIEKGERVGIGVAVAVMLLLVVCSLFLPTHGFFSGSPADNAAQIDKVVQTVDNGLRSNKPGPNDKPEPEADKRLIALDTRRIGTGEFLLNGGLFEGRRIEAPARRQPELYLPDEAVAAVARVLADTYIFLFDPETGRPTKVYVLADLKQKGGTPGSGTSLAIGRPSPNMPAMGSGPGGAAGSGPGSRPPAGSGPGMAMSMPGQVRGVEERKLYTKSAVDIKDLAKHEGTLARQPRPLRLAEIVATFPYKAQLEDFVLKLHAPSVQEVLSERVKDPANPGKDLPAFRFLGVKVQRREVDVSGAPTSEKGVWKDHDLATPYLPWLVLTDRGFEKEDPRYAAVTYRGLVMPRLRQFRAKRDATAEAAKDDFENHYPDIEKDLKKLNATLAALEAKKPDEIATPDQAPGGDFDPFNSSPTTETTTSPGGFRPGGGPGAGSGSPPPGIGLPPGGGSGRPPGGVDEPVNRDGGGRVMGRPGSTVGVSAAPATIPEHCLIRLIDLNIEPGKTYEYRIRARMANPNYGRTDVADPNWAKDPELPPKSEDDWYVVPQRVTVPPELMYYAVDQKEVEKNYKGIYKDVNIIPERGQTALQIHRWLGATQISKLDTKPMMIGEWAVADRVPAYRGEYVDRNVRIELPVWSADHNAFLIPTDAPPGRETKIPGLLVSFSHDLPNGLETILVDFDGGNQKYDRVVSRPDEDVKTEVVRDASATEVLLLTPEGKLLGHESAADALDPERVKNRDKVLARVERVKKAAEASKAAPGGTVGNPFDKGNTGSGKSPGGSQ